jgi:23S rRNA pseudoU1915 N3-methylase RlmH
MINSLDAIIKSTNFAQKINNQLDISKSMMKMINSQEQWQNKLSALTMNDAVFKVIAQQQNYFPKDISGLDALSKTVALQTKLLQIPHPTLDVIKGISQMHESIFGNLKGITSILESNKPYLAQINSLQFAMSGISGQIAAIAAKNNQWNLLDEFENINEQAFEITNSFTSNINLTEEESIRFEQLIEKIISFYNKNKKFGVNALLFISVMVNLMNIHQYYDFVKPKQEPVTKVDLIKFEQKIQKSIELKLKQIKEYRTTNRVSKVMLKPKTKTIIITSLPENFDVIVLQINHKWAFVSYINPNDNLMETGWIMKKYLDKNK